VGWTLTGMVALAFAIWLLDIKPKTKKSRRILTALGVLFVVFTAFTIQFIVHPSEGANAENAVVKNYQPFTPKTLEEALRESARPVFVNMTASWCITCLVNEKVTLNTPLIKDLFKTMDVTYLKGDWTNEDPAITEFLEQYGRSGVPLYVYYPSSDEATGERPAAVILPQILTPEMLFEIMQ
jgi:thiol:disulfide interchange protein DsbD